MRTLLILVFLMISFTSCKDAESDKSEPAESIDQTEQIELDPEIERDYPVEETNSDPAMTSEGSGEKNNTGILSGRYKKEGNPEDSSCDCYCLDIQPNSTSELCLSPNELYVNGRFEKDGENIKIYYSGKSARTTNSEIPWDQFGKNEPIAILSQTANGMSLDWIGFKIDGEIAVDYALYGKKTLEGTYKKL
ncbi:hypothetical protein E0K83_13620 [Gramella sp. BOM4]|nr:hypothetical protein [Christiangramia bathymodioli]